MPITRHLTLAALLLALAAPLRAAAPTDAAAQRVTITVRGEATVAPGIVRLGDVADIRNGDPGRVAAWKAIELFPAPAEDVPRNVPRRAIQDMIALRLGATPAADFAGAATIRVTTRPAAPGENDAVAAKPASRTRPQPAAEPTARNQPAPRRVAAEGLTMVVARHAISSGQTLTADDVELRAVQGPQQSDESVRLEDVVGKETTRPVGIGQAIDPGILRVPVVVHKNDMIKIIARTAGVRVQTAGKALGDAAAGELVEVQTVGSRDKILARAVGTRVVEVYGRGPSVAAQEIP
jgi:flagella basal body P-ring formation protein FlgA